VGNSSFIPGAIILHTLLTFVKRKREGRERKEKNSRNGFPLVNLSFIVSIRQLEKKKKKKDGPTTY